MRWLAALGLLALIALPGTAQAQLCGFGAPALYSVNGSNLTNTYGPTGCYWVPASNNASLSPSSILRSNNRRLRAWAASAIPAPRAGIFTRPGLGPVRPAPSLPAATARAAPASSPAAATPPWPGRRSAPGSTPASSGPAPATCASACPPTGRALSSRWARVRWPRRRACPRSARSWRRPHRRSGHSGPPVNSAPSTTTGSVSTAGTAGPSTGPPVPGRGGGNYIGDDPDQRGTVTIVRP